MQGTRRIRQWAFVAAAAACLGAVRAEAGLVDGIDLEWLCRPGLSPNPCVGDLTTRVFESDGSSAVVTPLVPAAPPIDCFYAYPTVSNQPQPNAVAVAAPEQRSIALYQAQRFSEICRVYAPLYRQVTPVGLTVAGQTKDTSAYDTAYADVRAAWRSYLANDNGGRGFVLLGHSQGSRMLRALIRDEIDPAPELRGRLVSAIIPGANATVATGQLVGGDFQNVPACTSGTETGCVIAYSTFNDVPPSNSRFGRTDTDPVGDALGLPTGPGIEVMCTDPTLLSGTAGRFESLIPSEPFAPGVIAALIIKLYRGLPPRADTPWLEPIDHYTGGCVTSNGANVLMITPVGTALQFDPSPDATWGVHLVDVNLALGNLVKIAAMQAAAWLAAHP